MADWQKASVFLLSVLLLSAFTYLPYLLVYGTLPGMDAREHIFRMLYFYKGMASGDYTPIQYHGYAFLANYGTLLYLLGYLLIKSLVLLGINAVSASMYAFIALSLLVAAFLVYAAMLVVFYYVRLRRGAWVVASALSLMPFLVMLVDSETIPYLLSFAFSLLALLEILKLRERNDLASLFMLVLFSALSIYSESYGYVFVFLDLLFLVGKPKAFFAAIALIAMATSFSWVQLIEVYRYSSPLTSSPLVGEFVFLFACFVAYLIYKRKHGMPGNNVLYKLASLNFLFAFLSIIEASMPGLLGVLGNYLLFLLGNRFIYINAVVFFLSSLAIDWTYAISKSKSQAVKKLSKYAALAVVEIFLLIDLLSSVYRAHPQGNVASLPSGAKAIIAPPALYNLYLSGAFAPVYNYSTVTGAFNQGDPSFYRLTVYYEWMYVFTSSWPSAYNLMELTGANELVLGDPVFGEQPQSANAFGFGYAGSVDNYSLYAANSSLADAVTPILLLSNSSKQADAFSLLVNLLAYNGYKLSFVSSYPNATCTVVLPGYNASNEIAKKGHIIRLIQSNDDRLVAINKTNFLLYANLSISSRIFPYAPLNVSAYFSPDYNVPPKASDIATAQFIADALNSICKPSYSKVNVRVQGSRYVIGNSSLPVLLKVSYYPYFSEFGAGKYFKTVYGFILLPHGNVVLAWHLPYYALSLAVSLSTLIVIAAALLVELSKNKIGKQRTRRRAHR